mmetsp:Transcript_21391/g.59475  ORF Transcript_21391/g.59475 Transcript_21391/m.59475 type:complete len:174 (-) Transcript_21391:945-1466(-)
MASRSRLMGGSTLYFYMWQCCLCSLPPQSKGWNGKTQIGEAERKRGWETMDIVNGIPRFRAPSGLCHPWLMRQHAMLCRLFSLQKHCILDIRYIEEGSRKDQGAQATAWLRSCSPREPHLVHWGRFIDTHTHMYRRWPCSSIRLAAHEDDGKAQRCNRGKAGHVYCDRACDCI